MVSVSNTNFTTEYEKLLLSMPPLKQTEEELWNIKKDSKFILDK